MTEAKSRILIFDPFSGISGDMILGGLLELGLSEDWLRGLVADLPLNVRVSVTRVKRGSIAARAVKVDVNKAGPRRNLEEISAIVDASPIEPAAREAAAATFYRLAEAEGAIHDLPPEKVHFHEVGAADSIIDVVAVMGGVAELDIDRCFTRPVAIGRGWVDTEHGALPLPAPATLKLLEGMPLIDSELEGEATTPTGAALLSTLTQGKRVPGRFTPLRSGFGAGSRNPSAHPNCLRLVLADLVDAGSLYMVQTDLDDMSPEYIPPLIEALRAAGATDVQTYQIQMKKGRTGTRIEALVSEARRAALSDALFESSTTIGLRFWPVDRQVLPRVTKTIEWRGFPIRVKRSQGPDGHFHWKAEYEDIIQAAAAAGTPPLTVRRQIEAQLRAEER